MTSIGESSPMSIRGPLHVVKEDMISYMEAIWWDAPESIIWASSEE
jgi:hypothetical protein